MRAPQGVAILGSTGSIGVNTLDVIGRHPDRFRVVALAANNRHEALAAQCARFAPRYAVMIDADAAELLRSELKAAGSATEVLCAADAMEAVASLPEAEIVMAAIVGSAGLKSTLAAARSGKRVLLANKEALVMAGNLLMDTVREGGATLLPIDSEHNAVFQAFPRDYVAGRSGAGVKRILLTASGGPFLQLPLHEFAHVTPEQACRHPRWVMGRKISVDSATMMNKGLEVIEACWLFDAPPQRVEIVIHPESIVHSMVEYTDGSVLAQLGNPDMRTPIAYALGFPDRIDAGVTQLDLPSIGCLTFALLQPARFPCVALAYQAIREGGTAPAILNGANEIAVAAFLNSELPFNQIVAAIENALVEVSAKPLSRLHDVLEADILARSVTADWVRRRRSPS